MVKDSLLIFCAIEFIVWLVQPLHAFDGWVRVVDWEMGGNAGMQPTNNSVEDVLLMTHFFELAAKAVLLIDELPDIWAVIISIAFNVGVKIEVFSFIVLFILDVPNPVLIACTLGRPFFNSETSRNRLLVISPNIRNIFFRTPADGAGDGLANTIGSYQWAGFLQVKTNDSKILGLYERSERGVFEKIQLFKMVSVGGLEYRDQKVSEKIESYW